MLTVEKSFFFSFNKFQNDIFNLINSPKNCKVVKILVQGNSKTKNGASRQRPIQRQHIGLQDQDRRYNTRPQMQHQDQWQDRILNLKSKTKTISAICICIFKIQYK